MRQTFHTLWPYLWRHRSRLALGMAALVMKSLCGAMLPIVIGLGTDRLGRGFSMEVILAFAAGLVCLSAIKGLFLYWMRVILVGISRDVEYEIRNDLFSHLLTLSSDFFARFRTGDLMARATNDLNAVRMMLGPGIMYWCETSIMFVLSVAVMLSVDWKLTLLALTPAPLISLAVVFFGGKIHARFERIQAMFSDISSRVQENLAGVRVLRAYVQEEAEMASFANLNRSYIGESLKLARVSGMFLPLLQALVGLTFLIVLWVGGLRLLDGRISLGQFVMFQTYMGMLIWPMIAFGWVVNLMQRGSASFARIYELLRERPSIAAPAEPVAVPEPLRGEIEFQQVGLRFPSGTALDGVSLRIEAGQTVAIVGHTGSGKTSLVKLIPRLADPTEGCVRIDGIDVRQFSPIELRRHIGFVPQETFLFTATLADNIAYGTPDAREDKIYDAAARAGLAPDIASFPDGLKTMVGERGITLSGGQKQRTAIARAILRDPRILILDDALSSVDTETEEHILQSLEGMMRGRTTILISHRVSTVRNAGRIYVVEEGRIAEQGSHTDLLAAGGYYADLYQRQLLEEELDASDVID